MARSLTRAASANQAPLLRRADGRIRADRAGRLRSFHALAQTATASSNVDAYKVSVFQAYGRALDARAIENHRAGGDRRAGQRAFRARQGEWFVRRVRFEALWTRGRELVYAALNVGGMGTEGKYGPFCLVFDDPQAAAPHALAVFPDNTAERYVSKDGTVDASLAYREAAPWPARAALAAIEREPAALTLPPDGWPEVVCSKNQFIEVVIAPGPPLEGVGAVRVRERYLEYLADLELRDVTGAVLNEIELWELDAFRTLNGWRKAHGTRIQEVP